MGLFGAILGGGLKGAGDGMLLDAKQKRDQAMQLLEQERADRRQREGDDRADKRITMQGEESRTTFKANAEVGDAMDEKKSKRDTTQRLTEIGAQGEETRKNAGYSSSLDERRAERNDTRQGGLIQSTYTDADGNEVAVFKNGATKVMGKAKAGASSEGGLSEADNRTLKMALELSDPDGLGLTNQTVREDVKRRLTASGNARLIPLITGAAPAQPRNQTAPKPAAKPAPAQGKNTSTGGTKSDTVPPRNVVPYVAGAKQAPDGHFYVPDPKRPGKFLKVE